MHWPLCSAILFRRPVLRNRNGTERNKDLVLFRDAFRLKPTNLNMLCLKRYAPMFRGTEQLKRYAPRTCYDTASIPFLVMLHLLRRSTTNRSFSSLCR